MRTFRSILFAIVFGSCGSGKTLLVKEYSEPLFHKPEAVVYDPYRKCLYVSNIDGSPSKKDGSGFISKTSTNGQPDSLRWVEGLDAPKGMFVKDHLLFCTDIDRVVVIDVKKGEVIRKIAVREASFLNDIIVTRDGTIIATDTKAHCLFIIDRGGTRKSSHTLKGANGIYYDGSSVYVGANGNIYRYLRGSDTLEVVLGGAGNVDGLLVKEERIIYTNYFNKLAVVENGSVRTLDQGLIFMDCKTDFCQLEDGTLVVPDFNSKLIFYSGDL